MNQRRFKPCGVSTPIAEVQRAPGALIPRATAWWQDWSAAKFFTPPASSTRGGSGDPRSARTTAPVFTWKMLLVTAAITALALGIAPARAQQFTTLIQFTNVWKFDQSGQELGTAWRTNDYDDSAWSSGRGLLGWEPDTPGVYTIHSLVNTPVPPSTTVTTFYFRATFDFAGPTNGLSLVASNLVDDGCAIYLNGVRVGGVRIPAGYNAPNAAQFFAGGTEGQLEAVTFTNLHALRQGNNLLAVEVHQAGNPNSDIMWGMKLMAIQQTALVITNQPQSQIVSVGDPITLRLEHHQRPVLRVAECHHRQEH